MPELSLTAIILTHNSQDHIIDCVDSLSWCPHLLIVDDFSTDYTLDLISKKNIPSVQHALNYDFATHRNFALSHVKTQWALFIDVDERVPAPLAREISRQLEDTSAVAFRLPRHDYFLGKLLQHGDVGQWNEIRLGKTKSGHWHGRVHETWQFSGQVGQLHTHLLHYPHPTVTEFIQEINTYTTIRARELASSHTKIAWYHIILYPMAKFFHIYIFKKGYQDGTHGLVHALCMTFHSFLVRSKLYVLKHASRPASNRHTS